MFRLFRPGFFYSDAVGVKRKRSVGVASTEIKSLNVESIESRAGQLKIFLLVKFDRYKYVRSTLVVISIYKFEKKLTHG